MKELTGLALTACAALAAVADTYDEKIEFVESTGSQYVDTGYLPNPRRTTICADWRLVEQAEAPLGLFGVCNGKDSPNTPVDSFAVCYGKKEISGLGTYYRVLNSFSTTIDMSGYVYPNAKESLAVGTPVRSEIVLAHAYHNDVLTSGQNGAGYNDGQRANARFGAGKSIFIGNVNNAGEGLLTATGPKVQWYRFRIYEDGELMRDYIPVKSGGRAGLFDLVNGTFCPSAGADDFVAPTEFVWKGGDDSDILAAENWVGGQSPTTIHDVMVVPAGTKIVTTATQFVKVGAIGGIRLTASDSEFSVTSQSATMTYQQVPFSGKGRLTTVYPSSSTYAIRFGGDSCNFEGVTVLSNTYVMVNNSMAFGETNRVTYWSSGSSQRFCTASTARFWHELHPARTGQYLFYNLDADYYGPIVFDSSYSATMNANASRTVRFYGPMTDARSSAYKFSLTSGYYAFLGTEKNLGKMQIAGANMTFGTTVVLADKGKTSNLKNDINVNLTSGTLSFSAENVFPSSTFVAGTLTSASASLAFNLQGCGQKIGYLGFCNDNGYNPDPASVWVPNLVLDSSTPATLTVTRSLRSGLSKSSNVFLGRVRGAASYCLDSDLATAGTTRFNCPGSDTTGSLIAKRGTITIMSTSTFSNLTSIVASGTGVVSVETSDVGNGNEEFSVKIEDETASIGLADGVEISALTFQLPGEGRFLDVGRYSGIAQKGVTECPYLTGSGVVEVRKYGGKTGLMLLFR